MISWTALLKKTPPEKFLNRPPVRFLFDLFQFCGLQSQGPGLGSGSGSGVDVDTSELLPSTITKADWAVVSATKQTKIDFMEVHKKHRSDVFSFSSLLSTTLTPHPPSPHVAINTLILTLPHLSTPFFLPPSFLSFSSIFSFFLQEMLVWLSSYLGIPPATTSTAIVAGKSCVCVSFVCASLSILLLFIC